MQGKISREEVAKICVAALESPYACDKTFEVIFSLSPLFLQSNMSFFEFKRILYGYDMNGCIVVCWLQVKCVLPFSEQYTVDPENPPPEKDYNSYFMALKDGITGKEALEKTVAAV